MNLDGTAGRHFHIKEPDSESPDPTVADWLHQIGFGLGSPGHAPQVLFTALLDQAAGKKGPRRSRRSPEAAFLRALGAKHGKGTTKAGGELVQHEKACLIQRWWAAVRVSSQTTAAAARQRGA